jgi:hypothetical protein
MRSPLHTSSPNHQENQRSKVPHNRNIRFATINFQSINAKKHSFWNFLDSSNTDIICGNETWFKPSNRLQLSHATARCLQVTALLQV